MLHHAPPGGQVPPQIGALYDFVAEGPERRHGSDVPHGGQPARYCRLGSHTRGRRRAVAGAPPVAISARSTATERPGCVGLAGSDAGRASRSLFWSRHDSSRRARPGARTSIPSCRRSYGPGVCLVQKCGKARRRIARARPMMIVKRMRQAPENGGLGAASGKRKLRATFPLSRYGGPRHGIHIADLAPAMSRVRLTRPLRPSTRQHLLQALPQRRPLTHNDAEVDAVPQPAAGADHVIAKRPFFDGADAQQRGA